MSGKNNIEEARNYIQSGLRDSTSQLTGIVGKHVEGRRGAKDIIEPEMPLNMHDQAREIGAQMSGFFSESAAFSMPSRKERDLGRGF